MSTAVMTRPPAPASPQRAARIAGGLYLVNIVLGVLAIGIIPASLIVPGDAAATLQHIEADELLYRLGLAAHMLILMTNAPLAVILYGLLTPVDRRLAALMVLFLAIGTAVEAATLLDQFTPLALLDGMRSASGAFSTAQVQALANAPLAMRTIGYDINAVFFGCYGITAGYLIFRSTFLPRAIGVLMTVGGSCYLIHSFATFLLPDVATSLVPAILLPSLVGEGALCLWLLVRGVNVRRWQAIATGSWDSATVSTTPLAPAEGQPAVSA